jgi:hypothetical protein
MALELDRRRWLVCRLRKRNYSLDSQMFKKAADWRWIALMEIATTSTFIQKTFDDLLVKIDESDVMMLHPPAKLGQDQHLPPHCRVGIAEF